MISIQRNNPNKIGTDFPQEVYLGVSQINIQLSDVAIGDFGQYQSLLKRVHISGS